MCFFLLYLRVRECEYYVLNIAKLWLPSHKYHSYCSVRFDIDFRTVELFSRQSIFIMSIAIYCSIGTLDRETISEIHSARVYVRVCLSVCVCLHVDVLLLYGHISIFRASADTVLHINVQNHKRNELRRNLSIDRIFSIYNTFGVKLRRLYACCVCNRYIFCEIKPMPTEKNNVHWYIVTHIQIHTLHTRASRKTGKKHDRKANIPLNEVWYIYSVSVYRKHSPVEYLR